jgi:hypothetical protein
MTEIMKGAELILQASKTKSIYPMVSVGFGYRGSWGEISRLKKNGQGLFSVLSGLSLWLCLLK